MKYLITGGCGFLGSNLADEVLKRGEELCVFDNLLRNGSSDNLSWLKTRGKLLHVHGDIRLLDDINKVIVDYKPDVIFHLAGQVAMTTSLDRPYFDFTVNALGTMNLLESVRKNVPEAVVIYSSTNKVYGDLEWVNFSENATRYAAKDFPFGFAEDISLDFHSPYGCSKGAADQYMLDYARMYDLRTLVFRHSSMYGSRQFASYDQGWVGWFCRQALLQQAKKNMESFTISGNGKQVRDLLYAEDLQSLYFSAVSGIEKVKGKVFNIGGGMENSLSLLELFEILEKKLNVRLKYTKLAPRISDQKVFVADIRKVQQILNWQPKVSAQDGISSMLEWQREKF